MKTFQFILLFTLFSCKKENIYYYSDNKPIKDSTVIRFVDEDLKKLDINKEDKNLKIYTTLDSTSYKTNLDSIRNKIFEEALTYNLKPEDKKAFDEWFREKIIVVDNKSGKVVNFYSSFRNKKYDRNLVNLGGLRKLIKLGTAINEHPEIQIPQNYMSNYGFQVYKEEDFKLQENERKLLEKLNIKDLKSKHYWYNDISFLEAITIFEAFNDKNFRKPFTIHKVTRKDETVYEENSIPQTIFSDKSFNKIQDFLPSYKNVSSRDLIKVKEAKSLIFFGFSSDNYLLIYAKNFTYLFYYTSAIITDLTKNKIKQIQTNHIGRRKIGIHYYNSIRK